MKAGAAKWIWGIMVVAASVGSARAQQILFRHYTAAGGLCSNTVWAISQDQKGYMWFGTKNGLNRFDGYDFRSYRHDKGDTTSLGGNVIRSILNCDEDSLWIGTEKGVYILNLPTGTFHLFQPLGHRKTYDLIRDSKNGIWIATDQGVFHYPPGGGTLKRYIHIPGDTNSLSGNTVRKLLEDHEGNIWIGTSWNGLDVLSPRTGRFRHYQADGQPGSISSNFITALYKDRAGRVWIGTEKGGLDLWKPQPGSFQVFRHGGPGSISDNIVHAIYQDTPGTLYVGTEKGLDILEIADGTFTNYAYRPNDPYSLSDNAVYAIFRDREGGVWLGTYFGGLDYFYGRQAGFELYYPTGDPDALSGKAVSAMLQDDSTHIWIATEDGGLDYFNTVTQQFRQFPFESHQDRLSYHNIHALMKDSASNLWIGTFTGGVNIYNPRTGKVKVYKFGQGSEMSSYSNMIYSICRDRDGTIWVGTVGGLYRYEPASDSFARVRDMDMTHCWVYDIYQDPRGILWFATYNRGLIGKDQHTGAWYHYESDGKPGSLNSEKVISLEAGTGDRLWIGTDGGGLNLLHISTGKITSSGKRDGMRADIIYGILTDGKGNLWLSSDIGLYAYNPDTRALRHYTQWDHLQSSQFNYKSYLKAWDGKFYFGGVHGLNTFYPDSISPVSARTRVILTGFQLFNREAIPGQKNAPLTESISYTRHLTLSHSQSMFSFEYAALNYIAPPKTLYAYRMEGYDRRWNYVGTQRKATYTNLPPGHYVFRVRATDVNGRWSTEETSIPITIRPPFYRTNLAYILYALMLIGLFLMLRLIELRRIRRRNAIKLERLKNKRAQEFYRQKIDFFSAMAHEIRTPLSLIIAPLERLLSSGRWREEEKDQLELMEKNSNRLLTLTNQLLDFRRMESDLYRIRVEPLELVSFTQSIFSRFSAMGYQQGIKFSISTQVQRLNIQADPEALTKVFSNLLLNAFKFTRTRVSLSISEVTANAAGKPCFQVSVEDDGIGIPASEVEHIFEKFYQVSSGSHQYSNLGGNGIGLALARGLVEKHGGNLLVESVEGRETIFTVVIPFDREGAGAASEADPGEENSACEAAGRPTLLIVEDDRELARFMARSLEADGFQVIKAGDGASALKSLGHHTVDLIISDVMMPEMDGLELCRKVKGDVSVSHIPFVLLTARANPETEISGIEEGADAYITKPFKWKHLSAVIKNLLDSRERLRIKFSEQPFAGAESLTTHKGDQKMLAEVIRIIEGRIDDPRLSVEELSREMAMSRSSLHKKLKAVSGHVPNEFIRLIRLKHAARLLLTQQYSVSEIGYMTGFNSPSYFSKCFFQQFRLTPREFTEKQSGKAGQTMDIPPDEAEDS